MNVGPVLHVQRLVPAALLLQREPSVRFPATPSLADVRIIQSQRFVLQDLQLRVKSLQLLAYLLGIHLAQRHLPNNVRVAGRQICARTRATAER